LHVAVFAVKADKKAQKEKHDKEEQMRMVRQSLSLHQCTPRFNNQAPVTL